MYHRAGEAWPYHGQLGQARLDETRAQKARDRGTPQLHPERGGPLSVLRHYRAYLVMMYGEVIPPVGVSACVRRREDLEVR